MPRVGFLYALTLVSLGCSRQAPSPSHESPAADGPSSNTRRSTPTDVLGDVIQLGADWTLTCALRANGEVYCWGQLAGIERDQERPRRVAGIDTARQIEVDGHRSYAVERSGDVVTWGGLTGPFYRHRRVEPKPRSGGNWWVGGAVVDEWDIELAEPIDPTLSAEAAVATSPREVHLDTDDYWTNDPIPPQWRVTARAVPTRLRTDGKIFLADEMLCVHDRDGSLSCVHPHFLDAFPSWNESQTRAEPGLVDIAASSVPEACLLRRDGSIECVRYPEGDVEDWGGKHFRVDRVVLPGPAAALASGWCGAVLLRDGRVVTWCDQDDETGHFSIEPTVHPEIDDAVAIDMGGPMICVLRREDRVTCWHVTRDAKFDMPEPRTITTLEHPTQLAVGDRHACALLADGHVQCWGANEHGQLGNGTVDEATEQYPSKIPDTSPTWVVAPEPAP